MSLKRLYIDREIASWPAVLELKARIELPAVIIDNIQEVFSAAASIDDPIVGGKQTLLLTRNKGAFIRNCPGTRQYTCCGYNILHVGTFCVMDCSYCILQAYFHPPLLQYFVNHEDMFKELNDFFAKLQGISRIGTGEFTDSMMWEIWTDLSRRLVPQFGCQTRAVLELKTKTTAIGRLQHLRHNRKTIAAWSLNTPAVIRSEERHTASLSARLKAASKCEAWGYPVAFHFDPMIIYEGCETDYQKVVEQIFAHVAPENVVWISMGTFRFMPALKPIIQRRFPRSKIVYGEFVPGLDGKRRYFKPLRIKLYKKVAETIRTIAPNVLVYLCMEDDEVWEKALGYNPAHRGGLATILDQQALRCCGLHAAR